jgi:hypothetical protein
MRRCGYCGDSGHNRRTCNRRSENSKKIDTSYYRKKSCGYCGNPGHTRPTCKQMDIDRDKWIGENAAYRKLVLEDIKKNGFGVGAVFGEVRGDKKTAYMVRNIHWDSITHSDVWSYAVQFIDMKTGMKSNTSLPLTYGHEGTSREHYQKYDNITIFIPAPEDKCLVGIPADWLSGKTGVPDAMIKKERKKRNEG